MPENRRPWVRLGENNEWFFYLGRHKFHFSWSCSDNLCLAGSSLYPSVTSRPDLTAPISTGNEGMKKKTLLTVKDTTVFLQNERLLQECRKNTWSFLAASEQIGVLGEWMKE